MTPTEKLNRVAKLCKELQDETNDAIVESRIAGLAKELGVNPFQCALLYWTLKGQEEFKAMFGKNVKVKFRAK